MKIESCKAGFSACGGSRSDKFLFAAVRSTRSAFLLYRKCDAISYKAKKRAVTDHLEGFVTAHFKFYDAGSFRFKLQTSDRHRSESATYPYPPAFPAYQPVHELHP